MLSTPFPVPEGWLGILPVPEHSHSRWILALCLTYGKQSLAQAAPPGVGTALALRVPPPMAFGSPGSLTKLGTQWGGRTELCHLRNSGQYLCWQFLGPHGPVHMPTLPLPSSLKQISWGDTDSVMQFPSNGDTGASFKAAAAAVPELLRHPPLPGFCFFRNGSKCL